MSELPGIGLPANAPARPTTPQAYPAVLDQPPPRSNTVLSDSEQQKLENDLVAARSRQDGLAGRTPAEVAAARKKASKDTATVVPASSTKTIY